MTMNLKKYLLLSSVALMTVACQEDKEPKNGNTNVVVGDEIKFGGELYDEANSRTAYGDYDEANKWYPITWVKKDYVYIYSPDVNSGNNQAVYEVAESGKAAGAFQKTTETGIQWGSEENARFYSVYPGIYNGDKPVTTSGLTFNLNMTNFQTCKYTEVENKVEFHLDSVDRFGAVMYAKTKDKVKTNNDVNLRYHPLSTALRIRLLGPAQEGEIATISSIKLKAPVAIAGDFTATFTDTNDEYMPTVAPSTTGTTYNEITLYAQHNGSEAFLTLPHGKTADLNFFIIPTTTDAGNEIEINDDWSIEVILAGYPKLVKKLGSKSGTNTKLKPGMVHRLDDLPQISLKGEWDISKWMTYIPRNVYLSEISIPGSWESMNPNFQGNNISLVDQYNNGCRAFHINCCYKRSGTIFTGFTYKLGIDNGGESTETIVTPDNVYMTDSSTPLFETALTTIAGQVKKDEYLVVMCTLRLKAGIPSGRNWMADVATACNTLGDKIFDGRTLTCNTTVGDALNKVIVIVNCEGDPANLNIPSESKCVFVNAPLKLTTSMFPTDGGYNTGKICYDTSTTVESKNRINLLSTTGQVTTLSGAPYVTLYRGFAPNLQGSYSGDIDDWDGGLTNPRVYEVNVGSRMKNCQALIKVSKDQFKPESAEYAHNQWYYFGLGGYSKVHLQQIPDNYDRVAQTLNNWMNGIVTGMATTKEYYPVGIVLMNFIQYDTYGSGTYSQVNSKTTGINILKLNNRYHKAYDPTKPAFPTTQAKTETETTDNTPSSRAAAAGWD